MLVLVHVVAVSVGIWQRVGNGTLRDMVFRNVHMETQFVTPLSFWGSGEALVVTSFPDENYTSEHGLRGIQNVTFENVVAVSEVKVVSFL